MKYAAPAHDLVPGETRRRSNPLDADAGPITRRALIGKGVPAAAAVVSALADVAGAPPAAQAAEGNPTGAIRRLRPECFGGRIETHAGGRKSYDIHSDILRCDGVARVKAANGTSLLPIAYPEGSPTHPSYPAAHACNAGVCATILKAFFNPDFVIRAGSGYGRRLGPGSKSLPRTSALPAMLPAYTSARTAFAAYGSARSRQSVC
jgi:hypothetical protein